MDVKWYVFLDSLSPKQACVVVFTWNGMSFWTHSAQSRHVQLSVPGMVCLSGLTQPEAGMGRCLYLEWYVFLDPLSPKQTCVVVCTWNGMSFWTHSAQSRHVQVYLPGMVCLSGLTQPKAGMCRCIYQEWYVFLDSLSPKQACVVVCTRNGMSSWTHSARSRHVQVYLPAHSPWKGESIFNRFF